MGKRWEGKRRTPCTLSHPVLPTHTSRRHWKSLSLPRPSAERADDANFDSHQGTGETPLRAAPHRTAKAGSPQSPRSPGLPPETPPRQLRTYAENITTGGPACNQRTSSCYMANSSCITATEWRYQLTWMDSKILQSVYESPWSENLSESFLAKTTWEPSQPGSRRESWSGDHTSPSSGKEGRAAAPPITRKRRREDRQSATPSP
ncbi:uncharacterized protein LOC126640379 [Myiozetetes cayanensis]|uniref:uncharacterized protein LOC126640379 n=1 Tax=Myiozetetes cayanensis TaxID=478635 RepID=UPI002160BED5|nr:uncharacterized protein LOC126640379 [Myiozetetes cayanensis]